MTSRSKADYLAKYLAGDTKKKKKKSPSSSLVIDQDDLLRIAPPSTTSSLGPQVTVRNASSASSSFSAPRDSIPLPAPSDHHDASANHAVNTVVIPKLTRPRGRHDSDSEGDDDDGPPRRRMRYDSDSDDEDKGKRGESQQAENSRGDSDGPTAATANVRGATIHRDARGRKVAIADLKQEAAAAEQAKVDKMNADKLFMMGRVQLEQMRERRRQLMEGGGDEAVPATAAAAASADPLRDRMRWGDPGAMLGLVEKHKAKLRDPDRPEYEGGWAPNRFMIPPGFRWDGIDRSNGFERKLLMRQNERAADEEAKYKWRSEDM